MHKLIKASVILVTCMILNFVHTRNWIQDCDKNILSKYYLYFFTVYSTRRVLIIKCMIIIYIIIN